MSVQQYGCAQQIYSFAQSLKSVYARTRAQLRGNIGPYHCTRLPQKGKKHGIILIVHFDRQTNEG